MVMHDSIWTFIYRKLYRNILHKLKADQLYRAVIRICPMITDTQTNTLGQMVQQWEHKHTNKQMDRRKLPNATNCLPAVLSYVVDNNL